MEDMLMIDGPIQEAPEFRASFTPAELSANFDALRAWAQGLVDGYCAGGLDPRRDADVRQAKRDRAYFNGLVKDIDQRRRAVKAAYSAPLKAFEDECGSVTAILKGAADQAGAVVAEGDRLYKGAKEQALRDHFEAFAGELAGVMTYEQLADPAWLNRTCSLARAKDELTAKVERVARDWEGLRQFEGCDHFDEAERVYFRTLDLAAALRAQNDAIAEDNRIAALKAAIDPAPAPVAADALAPAQTPEHGAYSAPEGATEATAQADEAQGRSRWVLEIDGATLAEVREVGGFMASLGVHGKFRRVTNE